MAGLANRSLRGQGRGEDQMRKSTANLPRKIGYHAAMARKYEHAAGYPWLPVEPDPPEPE